MSPTRAEAAVRACYATWAASYHDDYYSGDADYPPVHVPLVRGLLRAHRVRTVLDAGCGPASMLRDLVDDGLDCHGFDLTPEMVQAARDVLEPKGVPPSRIWDGSVTDSSAFHPAGQTVEFDAVLCIGVLPHVEESDEPAVLANLASSVRPGGLVVVQARNELFGLFTLNRYTSDLFSSRLIAEQELRERAGDDAQALDEALSELQERFRMDQPPLRDGDGDAPGYDEVLSRAHNPFELAEACRNAGLRDVQTLFFHYHRLPPLAAARVPKLARDLSLEMEDPFDWRGHVMASAFLVTGTRGAT